ncbi:MAG: hypothetical protein JO262_21440 [Solirubrobacterales bacterium]|nr:hypothetical protein [Solirubrobacterales bacterium]
MSRIRSLVLSGGGLVGSAWMLAVLDGLRRGGVNLGEADLLLGRPRERWQARLWPAKDSSEY